MSFDVKKKIEELNKSDIKVQSMFCTYSMDCIFRINEN